MKLPPPGALHTTEQAALALDVPAALIRKWAHRGKVTPCGYLRAPAPGGRLPLYRLAELTELADRYHARSAPTLHKGVLTAQCVCGNRRSVPVDTVTNGVPCDACGATTAEGFMQGPDRAAIARLLGFPPSPTDIDNVVYFARVGNLIKIGTTSNLWQRMASLGHPQLLGVMPGGYKVERQHHRRFATEHVTGEIFEATDRLLAYIREHCTRPSPPTRPDPAPTPEIPRWKRGL